MLNDNINGVVATIGGDLYLLQVAFIGYIKLQKSPPCYKFDGVSTRIAHMYINRPDLLRGNLNATQCGNCFGHGFISVTGEYALVFCDDPHYLLEFDK